jgi:hypothetical protein
LHGIFPNIAKTGINEVDSKYEVDQEKGTMGIMNIGNADAKQPKSFTIYG